MTTQEQLTAWENGRAELPADSVWFSAYDLIIEKLRKQLEAETQQP